MTEMARTQATVGLRGLRMPRIDYALVGVTLALLGLGLVMVASASLHKLESAPFHFVQRHLIAMTLGLLGGLIVSRVPVAFWQRSGTLLYFLGLLLLVLVLVPGVGREANGATRWIPMGPLNLQGSELMKLIIVVYIAGYLERRREEIAQSIGGFLKPMGLLAIACLLIMLEPDFGTTAVLAATALGMLFLGGVPFWQFLVLLALAGLTLGVQVLLDAERLSRVTSFLNPWADAQDSGYQLSQALIAFGRGEWSGVGLGNGIQKQFFLPEAHTDFLMAVVGEELGLVGSLFVIFLFGVIVARAFAIGVGAERRGSLFAAFTAYGLGLGIGLQAFINIGVNLGVLPTKGLTLPFMSYGSNSLIVACLAVALLLRIDHENRSWVVDHPKEARRWARV
jgi:cell division protein FtsW